MMAFRKLNNLSPAPRGKGWRGAAGRERLGPGRGGWAGGPGRWGGRAWAGVAPVAGLSAQHASALSATWAPRHLPGRAARS